MDSNGHSEEICSRCVQRYRTERKSGRGKEADTLPPATREEAASEGQGSPQRARVNGPIGDSYEIEDENFEWFVNNDRPRSSRLAEPQWLEAFTSNSTRLPSLKRPKTKS